MSKDTLEDVDDIDDDGDDGDDDDTNDDTDTGVTDVTDGEYDKAGVFVELINIFGQNTAWLEVTVCLFLCASPTLTLLCRDGVEGKFCMV